MVVTGVLLTAGGLSGFGAIANFLSRPILTGYLNGIALTIIAGQLGALFGYKLSRHGFFRTVIEAVSRLKETHAYTFAVGATLLVLLLLILGVSGAYTIAALHQELLTQGIEMGIARAHIKCAGWLRRLGSLLSLENKISSRPFTPAQEYFARMALNIEDLCASLGLRSLAEDPSLRYCKTKDLRPMKHRDQSCLNVLIDALRLSNLKLSRLKQDRWRILPNVLTKVLFDHRFDSCDECLGGRSKSSRRF
jgi:hypothetical protein